MLFGTTSTHFCLQLKINFFRSNNFKLHFLKKRFPDFVYDFSDRITYINESPLSVKITYIPVLLHMQSVDHLKIDDPLFPVKCVRKFGFAVGEVT